MGRRHEHDETGMAFRRYYRGAEKAWNVAFSRFPQIRAGVLHADKRADKALAQRRKADRRSAGRCARENLAFLL